MKKLLLLNLILFFLTGIINAQTATPPSVGDGSSDNPYQISSLANLYWVSASDAVVASPSQSVRFAAYYIQTANIDASATSTWDSGWLPIGNTWDNYFTGHYDGNGKTIYKLHITNNLTNDLFGFFGGVSGAIIKNLGIINIDINGINNGPAGGLVGFTESSTIENCYCTGNVVSNNSEFPTGGLVGLFSESSIMLNCHSACNTSGANVVGGLVGQNTYSEISDCYYTGGTVSGTTVTYSVTGGLVGGNDSSISKCYSTGTVIGYYYTGGLVGINYENAMISNSYNRCNISNSNIQGAAGGGLAGACLINVAITNCYSAGTITTPMGGLVGNNHGSTFNSFYDFGLSPTNYGGGGTGKTTLEMKTQSTFSGWDFSTIWGIDASVNDGYPNLNGVSSILTASVSIEANPAGSVCQGTSVTYTATPVNGGTPTYQWMKNGTAVEGETGSTFTTNAIADNDAIVVVMTSSLSNVTGSPATSNSIVPDIISLPVVLGEIIGPASVCTGGIGINYSVAAVPGATSYNWNVPEGAEIASGSGTNSIIVDFGSISGTVSVTATNSCSTSLPVTLGVTVNPELTPSVTITSSDSDNKLCSGVEFDPVFTAHPANTNEGTVNYQWYKNEYTFSTWNNVTWIGEDLSSRDEVRCEIIVTKGTCSVKAVSNIIKTEVYDQSDLSVTIESSVSGTFCYGKDVIFTATPLNTGGGTVAYEWKLNNEPVGLNQNTYNSKEFVNNDRISCEITVTNAACYSLKTKPSNEITVSVYARPEAGSIIGTTPILAGHTAAFSVTGNSISGTWFSSDESVAKVSETGEVTAVGAGSADIGYFVSATGPCEYSDIAIYLVTVTSELCTNPTNGGTIYGDQTICSGSDPAAFASTSEASGYTGTLEYKWQYSDGNDPYDWDDLPASNSNYFDDNQTSNSTRWYRRLARVTCSADWIGAAESNVVEVTVNLPSVAPTSITGTTTICNGSSTTLTAAGGTLGTGASWKWYSGSCSGTPIAVGSSATLSPTVTTTYYVRAEGDCNISDCANVTVTVKTLSLAPSEATASVNNICPGTSTTLSLTGGSLGTEAAWKWYSGSCSGTPIAVGSSTTVSPTSTTTYYVRAEGECNTTDCASITINVNAGITPSVTIVSGFPGDKICSETNMTFTATPMNIGGGIVSYQWYRNGIEVGPNDNKLGLIELKTGEIVSCSISITGGSCLTSQTAVSNNIVLEVYDPSLIPEVTISSGYINDEICPETNVNFIATPINTNSVTVSYQWYRDGVEAGQDMNSLYSMELESGVTISCTITIAGPACYGTKTATSNEITIKVKEPEVVIYSNDEDNIICQGATVTFEAMPSNLSGGTVSYTWFLNEDFNNIISKQKTFTTSTLSNGDVVYCAIEVTGGTCSGVGAIESITITVNPQPAAPTATKSPDDATVCAGHMLTLTGVTDNGGGTGTCNIEYSINGADWTTTLTPFAATVGTNTIAIRKNCNSSGCDLSPVSTYRWSVNSAPTFTLQPENKLDVCAGGGTSATFTTTATGTAPISYLWYKVGANQDGSDKEVSNGGPEFNTLRLSPVTLSDAGSYYVNATNDCGTTKSNVVQLTVESTQPQITCPGNITVNNTIGTCGAIVTYDTPVGTDNCPNPVTTQIAGLASGSTFPIGVTTNTFKVIDGAGLFATCSFTVTVTDVQAPQITPPDNITVNNNPGNCSAVVIYNPPVGTDNCPNPVTTQIEGLPSGSAFPVGVTTNRFKVTDGVGLTATCYFTVTVVDNQAPDIVCPADLTNVTTDQGQCFATVSVNRPVVTDICDQNIIPVSNTNELVINGNFNDGISNWQDCPNNAEVNPEYYYIVPVPAPSSNKVAEIDRYVNLCQNISGFMVGKEYVLTFLASRRQNDGTPNPLSVNVSIDGGALNTVVSRNNKIFKLTRESFIFTASATTHKLIITPGTNNTSSLGFIIDDISVKESNTVATFPVGTTTQVWIATDAHGNTATCEQKITVTDNEAPTLANTLPGGASGNLCKAAAPTAPSETSIAALYTDNCTGGISASLYSSSFEGSDCSWTATYTYKVKDAVNNYAADAIVVYTGGDTQNPALADEVVTSASLNSENNNWCLSVADDFDANTLEAGVAALYTDNCGTVAAKYTGKTAGENNTNCRWSFTYHFTIDDGCGNDDVTCDVVYSGGDITPPIARCKNITIYLETDGYVDITAADVNNGSHDNCNSEVTLGISLTHFSYSDLGTDCSKDFNVTLTVTDECNNPSTCTSVVTVKKRPTEIVYSGDLSGDYSDLVNLSATLKDITPGGPATALEDKTLKFTIGSQSVSDIYGGSGGGTDANGLAEATIVLNQNPNVTYDVVSNFAGDNIYCGSTDSDPFTINCENDVTITTDNSETYFTANPSSGKGDVWFRAYVEETDDSPGNIANANIEFMNELSSPPSIINPAPALVTPIPGEQKAVSVYTFSDYQLNNSEMTTTGGHAWLVRAQTGTGSYYCGEDVNEPVVFVLAMPGGDFVTGGGKYIHTQSAGVYAATAGTWMNFGFNMKWNKSGKNLQGNINVVFRNGTKIYHIKSNAINALAVSQTTQGGLTYNMGIMTTKANLTDITDPLNPLSTPFGGNLNLKVVVWDATSVNGGSADKITVELTASSDNTTLIYSNFASGINLADVIKGGNINVRNTSGIYVPPTCGAPTNVFAANLTQTSAQITWDAVTYTSTCEVKYKLSTSSVWSLGGTTTGNTLAVSGLIAGSNYDVQVFRTCDGNTTPLQSAILTFTTTADNSSVCTVTGLIALADNTNKVTLSWSPVNTEVTSPPVSYKVEYKKSTATTWTVVNSTMPNLALTLATSTKYNWRVTPSCGTSPAIGPDFTTGATKTKVAEIATGIVPEFEYTDLKVYPNPFCERLRFEFVSPVDNHVRIQVFDVTGRLINTVFDDPVKAGISYNTEFKPASLVNSIYFYRMTLGEKVFVGKVIYKK